MLLIVAHHFSVHGGISLNNASYPLTGNLFFAQVLAAGGKLGVNIFILISGYFLATRIVKITSLIKIWITTFFYSVILFAVFVLLGRGAFSEVELIKQIFPITSNRYWFVSCYFVLMLFSPFLSFAVARLGKKRLKILLVVMGVVWSVIPTVLYTIGYYKTVFYFSDLLWFIFLFIVASYIRLYIPENKIRVCNLVQIILCSVVALMVWILSCDILARQGLHLLRWSSWYSMNSLVIVTISVALLLMFRQFHLGSCIWINQFAACMFGVYLIHDNHLVRPWLWKKVCHVAKHFDRPEFIAWALMTIVGVFLACMAIEYLRMKIMDKTVSRILQPLQKWDDKFIRLMKDG